MRGFCSVVVIVIAGVACVKDDIPRQASGQACDMQTPCPAAPCTCGNSDIIIAQHCVSFRCQTSDDACPTLCSDRGGWTRGDAAGFYCGGDHECPSLRCVCANGVLKEGGACIGGSCVAEEVNVCPQRCADEGGWEIQCSGPGEPCFPGSCCFGDCGGDGLCMRRGR